MGDRHAATGVSLQRRYGGRVHKTGDRFGREAGQGIGERPAATDQRRMRGGPNHRLVVRGDSQSRGCPRQDRVRLFEARRYTAQAARYFTHSQARLGSPNIAGRWIAIGVRRFPVKTSAHERRRVAALRPSRWPHTHNFANSKIPHPYQQPKLLRASTSVTGTPSCSTPLSSTYENWSRWYLPENHSIR